jgi:hypothetical protein
MKIEDLVKSFIMSSGTQQIYNIRVCGAMDNASDYESGDCRFDPCQTRTFFLKQINLQKLI